MITHISDATFEAELASSHDKPMVVDFWAPWCAPCKIISPILDQIDQEYGDKIKICKINIEAEQEVAGRFSVMSIPTLILFKAGVEVARTVGGGSKSYLEVFLGLH